jgi:hypothetical protein
MKSPFPVQRTKAGAGSTQWVTPSLPIHPLASRAKRRKKFIERALALTKPRNGLGAMLLKVDFGSGAIRRRFFADCPAWACKLVLLKRILWFESRNGMGPSENTLGFYGPGDMPGRQ